MRCRCCGSALEQVFSLGSMPLVNAFLKKEELDKEKKYPLNLCFCQKCFLVQLSHTIPSRELYSNYLYFSSTSSSFLQYCEDTANKLIKRLGLIKDSLVLEVASNDGAQLKYFQSNSIKVLGVDPAKNIVREANKNGITTICDFFSLKLARELVSKKKIQADLIFGANVLAHVPKIIDFVSGIKLILKPHGTAVFEFPYLEGLLENKFDTIYHEHIFYYSLLALRNLFSKANLAIYDVEMTQMQGGSLQIFVSHTNMFPISKNVDKMLAQELKAGFDKVATYRLIKTRVDKLKASLLKFLLKLKKADKRIAAYSAPAKGNVLLNYFGIGNNYLDFIVDKSPAKQGLYTPGTHLLVYPPNKIYAEKPDYLLILCWNIADEVIKEHQKFQKACGKFIIPVPKLKIL